MEHASLANLANTNISKVLLYVWIANLASTPTQSVQQQMPRVKLAFLAPARHREALIALAMQARRVRLQDPVRTVELVNIKAQRALSRARPATQMLARIVQLDLRQQ